MNRLQTIPRLSIDYHASDFLAGLRNVFSRQLPRPDAWLPAPPQSAAFWTGSGRQALRLILRAMHLEPGAKVAVPLYCDPSVAAAIRSASCVSVFVDIDQTTLTMDPESLRAIRGELAAIVVPHFFGHVADIDEIQKVADGIPIIEDVAHAPLSLLRGRRVGTFGIACFHSLGSTKPIPAGGGGIAIANDAVLADALAAEARKLISPIWYQRCLNLFVHAAKATVMRRPWYGAVGRAVRPHIEARRVLEPTLDQSGIHVHQAHIASRQAQRFQKVVEGQRRNSHRLLSLLANVSDIVLPWEREGTTYNFHIFPVVVSSEAEKRFVREQLLRRHVDTSEMYWDMLGEAQELGYRGGCPVSESVARRMLTLPNHAAFGLQDMDYIAKAFAQAIQEYRLRHPAAVQNSFPAPADAAVAASPIARAGVR